MKFHKNNSLILFQKNYELMVFYLINFNHILELKYFE